MKKFNPLEDLSLEELKSRLSKLGRDLVQLDGDSYRWMIEDHGRCVGSVALGNISWRMGYAEMGYVIGEAFHGQGYGKAAAKMLIDKVFAETDLTKLMAYVAEENIASRKILEGLHFVQEGFLREHYLIQGQRVNEILYALHRRDYDLALRQKQNPVTRLTASPELESKLVDYLINQHQCHTIILYGSLARGDASHASDVDVLGINSHGEAYRIGRPWDDGLVLDAWIYSDANLPAPDALSHLKDGKVLKDRDGFGETLLKTIRATINLRVNPMPHWEREQIVTWIKKMLQRSRQGDAEGGYRFHWLLYELLPFWFSLQGRKYFGPKESLNWLKQNEPRVFRLFADAFDVSLQPSALERLADEVIGRANLHHSITLRPAVLSDAPGIAKVHVDCWRTAYQGSVPQDHLDQLSYAKREQIWTSILERNTPGHNLFVAVTDDNRVVGLVDGGANRTPDMTSFEGEVNAIYLLEEFQNIGLGKKLFLRCLEQLTIDGFKSAVVWVLADNPTRHFYARLGGELAGERIINIGGTDLKELAFGWSDLKMAPER